MRDIPALKKDPVNDRKGNLSGLWLETFDCLLTHLRHSRNRSSSELLAYFALAQ